MPEKTHLPGRSKSSPTGSSSLPQASDDETLPLLTPKPPSDSEEEEQDVRKGDVSTSQLAVMLSCLGALVVLGVTTGMVLEQWHFITALYTVVQLMTTIGYGDFALSTDAMKLVFSFIGCCTLVIYICIANKLRGDWHKDFLRHQLEKVEAVYVMTANTRSLRASTGMFAETQTQTTESGMSSDLTAEQLQDEITKAYRRCNRLIIATVPALLDITFGTLFYSNYEACTCSYGASLVPGCNEDSYEACVKSGGYTKTPLSAFYMSVMTVLTVGFGDYSPRSKLGRAVGVVWMLTGVASMANWLTELSNFIYSVLHVRHHHHHHHASRHPCEDTRDRMASIMEARNAFSEMDADGDGQLSRAEFRMYFLLNQKLVSREALKAIDKYFDELDKDHSNFVTSDEVVYAQMRRGEERGCARRAHPMPPIPKPKEGA